MSIAWANSIGETAKSLVRLRPKSNNSAIKDNNNGRHPKGWRPVAMV